MDGYRAIGNQCLALHLRRAARQLGRLYDEALRPAGINNGQFAILAMLAARDGWTMQTLADALGLDQSSLSTAVKPLERRGLASRQPGADDARVRRLQLTADGRAALATALPLWRRAQDRAEARLGGHDPETVRSALRQFG